jgi:hypothetical protein
VRAEQNGAPSILAVLTAYGSKEDRERALAAASTPTWSGRSILAVCATIEDLQATRQ